MTFCRTFLYNLFCSLKSFVPSVQVTLEEVNSQVALEYGQAMTVRVCKPDGEVMREFSWSRSELLQIY